MEKEVINHSHQSLIKISNGTVDVGSSNHEENDTIMSYCLGFVGLENEVVCVNSNHTDVFTIILGNYEKLNSLTLLIPWSNLKWMNLTKVYAQPGAEKAKALIGFHCFSDCDTW